MIEKLFTKEIVAGILRHALTVIGGLLIAKGAASPEKIDTVTKAILSPECIGAIVTFIGVAKSCMAKTPAASPKPTTAPLETPRNQ